MNTNPSPSLELGQALPLRQDTPKVSARAPARVSGATRAESMQKAGKRMILAGFVITIVGVILYCAVCFAGGVDADLGDILFRNAVPFARGALAVLGLGTLVWLVGSFTYLKGAMDADEDAGQSRPTED